MRIMSSSRATLAIALLAIAAVAMPVTSAAGKKDRFKTVAVVGAKLKGQTEVPGPGDPTGRGTLEVELKKKVKGCVRIQGSLLRKLKRQSERYYVNVRNSEYPDGAIRGQLELVKP